ncbi:hypothetical protein ACHAW6_000207 [Cyclotella cf. meneghiniana]
MIPMMLVGTAHKQPAKDTHAYEVSFLDGCTNKLAANTIAEASFAQCKPEDYRKNSYVAISLNNQVKIVNGKKVVSHITRGWELSCEWKDGSTSWQKLSDIKDSHPLQVAEFALALGIANEPAYNWRVTWGLKKRDQLSPWLSAEAPETTNGPISHWYFLLAQWEMKNVQVAFYVLADGVAQPSDHQYIKCHMIFDVKMEDFHHKALLIARGHMTEEPANLTYSSIMFQETVRIVLLVAALY